MKDAKKKRDVLLEKMLNHIISITFINWKLFIIPISTWLNLDLKLLADWLKCKMTTKIYDYIYWIKDTGRFIQIDLK